MEPHHGGLLDPSMTQYFTAWPGLPPALITIIFNYHIPDPCKCPDYTQYFNWCTLAIQIWTIVLMSAIKGIIFLLVGVFPSSRVFNC